MSHDHSEIILICQFGAQEIGFIIIIIEHKCCLFIYLFIEFFDMILSGEQYLFEIKIFCSIIKVFTVTFDQFNASLLNKNNFFQKAWCFFDENYWLSLTPFLFM